MLDAIAWYGGNSGVDFDLPDGWDSSDWPDTQHPHTRAGTRRVGQKLANPWGLHDMLGNVWEWCSDWFDSESYSSRQRASDVWLDPAGPARGGIRVARGGSWFDNAEFVRAAYRYAYEPGHRDSHLGLRLAWGQGIHEGPDDPATHGAPPR